jgi:hypothetical protein
MAIFIAVVSGMCGGFVLGIILTCIFRVKVVDEVKDVAGKL